VFNPDGTLNFERLAHLSQKPPIFAPGEPAFWTDPHIAQQMLNAHLDPKIDAASRRPALIGSTVEWIIDVLNLQVGDTLLDLGCGPGLYCQRFSRNGLKVTGVDFSANSIRYAQELDFKTTYSCQDYLTLDFDAQFDVVTLIFGDLCALSREKRSRLLTNIHQALRPNGYFVLDVTTFEHHTKRMDVQQWSVLPNGGFWKPTPYLQLINGFHYPEDDTALDQYIIIEAGGRTTVYRNWFHYYSPETITAELEAQGFIVEGLYSDLWGTPYQEDSGWIGVVARKV
jgi:SAM-dependent methyltransferase